MALRIALTGGIGSGKSFIADLFAQEGVPIYKADTEAKRLLNEDDGLKRQIIQHFGSECYSQGYLNKSHLASLVFNHPANLEKLNGIVHPAVRRDAEKWFQKHKEQPYAIKEAALIFETEQQGNFDRIILVHAPKEMRILRVMQRDNCSKESVEARMNHQLSDEEKMGQSHMILNNDGQQNMEVWVQKMHQYFSEMVVG